MFPPNKQKLSQLLKSVLTTLIHLHKNGTKVYLLKRFGFLCAILVIYVMYPKVSAWIPLNTAAESPLFSDLKPLNEGHLILFHLFYCEEEVKVPRDPVCATPASSQGSGFRNGGSVHRGALHRLSEFLVCLKVCREGGMFFSKPMKKNNSVLHWEKQQKAKISQKSHCCIFGTCKDVLAN